MYFRVQTSDVPLEYLELITTGQVAFNPEKHLAIRSLTGTNFREEMARNLFSNAVYKPLDPEFALVETLFETSTSITIPCISASVYEIIFIYNTVVRDLNLICHQHFDKDPIRILVNTMGGQPIKL